MTRNFIKKIILVFCSLLLFSKSANAKEKQFTVFLLGDSLAEGLSPHFANDFKQENIKFVSMFKRGTTIRYWARNTQLKSSLLETKPELILISLGTNDMIMPNPLEETRDMVKLLETCHLASNQVIWLLPPPMPFPDYGVVEMVEASKVMTLDPPDLQGYRAKDKIHLTYKGYMNWADYIFDMLLGD